MMKNTNTQFIILAIFIIVSQLLLGCSAQSRLNRKLDRAERFAKKYDLVIKDTLNVTVRDTIYFESVRYDTTHEIVHHDTTVIVNNERMRAVYFYDTLTREIWHELECKGDTVYTERIVRVPVDKIKKMEGINWRAMTLNFLIGIVIGCLIGVLILIILKRIKH